MPADGVGYPLNIRDDVAQIQHEGLESFGSGRLIADRLVLTARHVVAPEYPARQETTGFTCRVWKHRVPPPGKWDWMPAKLVWLSPDEKSDLALLRIEQSAPLLPAYSMRIASFDSTDGHEVSGTGFATGS